MSLDHSKLLSGVEVPQLNDALDLATVEKRSVNGQRHDGFGIIFA